MKKILHCLLMFCFIACLSALPAWAQESEITDQNIDALIEALSAASDDSGAASPASEDGDMSLDGSMPESGNMNVPEAPQSEFEPMQSHSVTAPQSCFKQLDPADVLDIRKNFSKPYQECQRRLQLKLEAEKKKKQEVQQSVTSDMPQTPRNYVRVKKTEDKAAIKAHAKNSVKPSEKPAQNDESAVLDAKKPIKTPVKTND